MLIDTHAHLYSEEFDVDLEEMLARAVQAGVDRIYLPNVDLQSVARLKSILHHSDILYPMMGLHPCSVRQDFESVLVALKSVLTKGTYHGIGEIGLDLYWDKTTLPFQMEAFKIQCQWAVEFNLPIIIHSRQATTEVLDLLEQMNPRPQKGIFHCFSGTIEEINRVDALGEYYYGIGGVITYKNAGLAELVPLIPKHKLVLETDSPYLAPAPHRGKRNESSFLYFVNKKLSDCLQMTEKETAMLTTANALQLFHKG